MQRRYGKKRYIETLSQSVECDAQHWHQKAKREKLREVDMQNHLFKCSTMNCDILFVSDASCRLRQNL